ncbi:Histidine kinase [Sediminibacterium ginsengisoli]|uniref:Histidine kinase n=1 Tax=Sediminibacterium ginsengisoli TaxID=413434 RepID=A0A1T4R159_9BACT|nr:Histidine kinase [Sediminibacterium ginsengisoli]
MLLLLSVLPAAKLAAQQDSFGHVFMFDVMTTLKDAMVREPVYITVSDTAVYRIFDRFREDGSGNLAATRPKSEMILGVKLNPALTHYYAAWVQSVSKVYPSFVISDSSCATLIALGINKRNYHDYIYRVVENDSLELIPWQPVSDMEQQYGAKEPYGNLGTYSRPGKRLMVEVMRKNDYNSRDGIIFDWRSNFMPVLKQITVQSVHSYFNLAYPQLNRGYATRFDRQTGIPLDFRFPGDSIRSLLLQFNKPETVVYTAYLASQTNGQRDTSRIGFIDQYGAINISNSYFGKAGHYEVLVIRQQKYPDWNNSDVFKLAFEVLAPASGAFISLKRLLLYAGLLILLASAGVVIWRRYTLLQIRKADQQRSVVQLRLKSIRAQLNPHFMFNALASIQNLVNKQDLRNANHFLTTFARLTRRVLNTSEQETISLAEEVQIISDYLEMEQLRFGFRYHISVGHSIDQESILIPSMLLQPFIENAVKHGIAGLQENGIITVHISQSAQDLVLTVQDNGKGFQPGCRSAGSFGLKLSEERIHLLNSICKDKPVLLDIFSEQGKTLITIMLKNRF